MKRTLRIVSLLALLVIFASLSVFAKDITVGVAFDFVSNPIRQAEIKAIEETAAELGVKIVTLSAELDAQRQVSQVEDLINRGVDSIIILPHDQDVVVSAIRRANSADIPVITIDRRAGAGGEVAYHVGAGPYLDGRDAAQFMVYNALASGKKLTVLELIGALTDENAVERQRGFLEIVNQWPSNVIEVVASVPTEWQPEMALDGAMDALQAHPDINAIFTPSDFLGPAIFSALEINDKLHPMGHENHVMVVGIDGNEFAWENIENGYYTATIATLADELGVKAITAAARAARGERLPTSEDIISGLLVHKENQEKVKNKVWGAH